MQEYIQKVALQTALVGSISLSSFVLRRFYREHNHDLLNDTYYTQKNVNICHALNGISKLNNNAIFEKIVKKIETILSLAEQKGNPWDINRKISNVIEDVQIFSKKTVQTFDQNLLTTVIDVEKEYLPILQSELQNVLHNILLDRH